MYTTVNSSDYIQVIVTSAPGTVDVDFYCDFFDATLGALNVSYGTLIAVSSPLPLIPTGSGSTRQVQAVSIYNAGTSSITVAVQYFDGVLLIMNLFELNLPTGYMLTYTADGAGWQLYSSSGNRI